MNDSLNTVETEIVDFLKGNSNVTGLVAASKIHEKVREDIKSYLDHELPAVAVHATGYYDTGDKRKTGIEVYGEIVYRYGTLATGDNTVKEILSMIRQELNNASPYRDGEGIEEQFDDIYVSEGDVVHWNVKNGWQFMARFFVRVEIME